MVIRKPTRTDGSRLLEEWLDRTKLQKQAVAELLGISPSHLAHLVSGHRRPGLAKGVEIQELTGIPVTAWKARQQADLGERVQKSRRKS